MKKLYSYERYTLRLSKDLGGYIKATAERRGISPTDTIKAILGEYRERSEVYGEKHR